MAVKWIFLWMGPGLSKAEVIHCLVRGRRTPENRSHCLRQRGQGNFKLAANFGYGSRGSADPRESLRKRRILKLALTAHKVSKPPDLCLPPAEHPDGQTSRSLVFSLTNN